MMMSQFQLWVLLYHYSELCQLNLTYPSSYVRLKVGSPCWMYREISHLTVNWCQPLLGDCGKPYCQGHRSTAMDKLGYILSGPLPTEPEPHVAHVYTTLAVTLEFSYCTESPLDTPTHLEHSSNISPEPFMVMYQRDHIFCNKDGYYVVHFPWRPNHPILVQCDLNRCWFLLEFKSSIIE